MTKHEALQKIKIYSVVTGKRYYEIAHQLHIDKNRFYAVSRGDRHFYPHEIEAIKKVTSNIIA